jgi:CO/xanthine dehydrogenase FAD-binding subunit
MPLWKEYFTPNTVAEAIALRERYGADALFVAGGTDLILDLQQGNHAPVAALVDVTAIEHLNEISEEDGWVVIGAAVAHADVEASPLVRRHGLALAESCGVVGGPQVRNVATLGGNVAHALPAADGTIGLLALDAQVSVCTLHGEHLVCDWRPLLSIFAGPGKNTLASNQMIAGFRFPMQQPGQGSAFDRIMRPQGVALPILGVATKLMLDPTGSAVTAASLVIGPAGPIPFRATDAERLLIESGRIDDAVIDATLAAAQAQAELRTSKHRATKEYRHEMVAVLLRRVLWQAVARARLTE